MKICGCRRSDCIHDDFAKDRKIGIRNGKLVLEKEKKKQKLAENDEIMVDQTCLQVTATSISDLTTKTSSIHKSKREQLNPVSDKSSLFLILLLVVSVQTEISSLP